MTSSPGTDTQRHERQQQGVGAGGNADGIPLAAVGCGSFFELRHKSPENKLLT